MSIRPVYADLGNRFEAQARVRVPVRTGRLRASIRSRPTTRGVRVLTGGTIRTPYAEPIHFGWPKRGIKAQPYLLPIWYDRIVVVKAVMYEGIHDLYPFTDLEGLRP